MRSVYNNEYVFDNFSFHIFKNSEYIIEAKGSLTSDIAFVFVQKLLELKQPKLILDFVDLISIDNASIRILTELSKIISITIWNPPNSLKHLFTNISILP